MDFIDVLEDEFSHFCPELAAFDGALIHFPQRSVSFVSETCNVSILLDQHMGNVGSTLWDSEVILAHHLFAAHCASENPDSSCTQADSHHHSDTAESATAASCTSSKNSKNSSDAPTSRPVIISNPDRFRLPLTGKRVLELGAGTGLAGILCARLGARVVLQELPDRAPFTAECAENNISAHSKELISSSVGGNHNLHDSEPSQSTVVTIPVASNLSVVGARWGPDLVASLCTGDEKFDLVIMSDVLYVAEDFSTLAQTALDCLCPGGCLLLSVEQRRRDLSTFFQTISTAFESARLLRFTVRSSSEDVDEQDVRLTQFFLLECVGATPDRLSLCSLHK